MQKTLGEAEYGAEKKRRSSDPGEEIKSTLTIEQDTALPMKKESSLSAVTKESHIEVLQKPSDYISEEISTSIDYLNYSGHELANQIEKWAANDRPNEHVQLEASSRIILSAKTIVEVMRAKTELLRLRKEIDRGE